MMIPLKLTWYVCLFFCLWFLLSLFAVSRIQKNQKFWVVQKIIRKQVVDIVDCLSLTMFWSPSRYCFSNEKTSPFKDLDSWQIRLKVSQLLQKYELVFCSHVTLRIRTLKLKWHGSNAGSNCLDKSYLLQSCYWRVVAKSNAFNAVFFVKYFECLSLMDWGKLGNRPCCQWKGPWPT